MCALCVARGDMPAAVHTATTNSNERQTGMFPFRMQVHLHLYTFPKRGRRQVPDTHSADHCDLNSRPFQCGCVLRFCEVLLISPAITGSIPWFACIFNARYTRILLTFS